MIRFRIESRKTGEVWELKNARAVAMFLLGRSITGYIIQRLSKPIHLPTSEVGGIQKFLEALD